MSKSGKLFEELERRGFVDRITDEELKEKIDGGGLRFYMGFDPTGDSLHVGHLAALNLMRSLRKGGHRPICLMGGATGMIGDPGGKSKERNLLSAEEIERNIKGVKEQLARFLDFEEGEKTVMLNNSDWLSKFSVIDFLRDIGKHFSVNAMMVRDSVKNRLEREGEGVSYTEFSYMILQAYDFYYLSKKFDCVLQLGGSDQWGNIVSGIDLSRRLGGRRLYGATMPLLVKSDGSKFGKSEDGAIWLSAEKTSPYEFYQFFLRQKDKDAIPMLKTLTQVSLEEIGELEENLKNEPHKRAAQKKLAEETTRAVHGQEALDKAVKASRALFGEKIENLDDRVISQIFKDVPYIEKDRELLVEGFGLVDALAETGACKSRGQARKLILSGGAYVNNERQKDIEYRLSEKDLASPSFLILRSGKKNYRLIRLSGR